MIIKATLVRASELKPGDLFSTAGPLYWDNLKSGAIGEKVYIRTDAFCPEDEADYPIYRIEIER